MPTETNTQTRSLPALQMRASFDASTLNEENRTVEVVFVTETPVLMGYWDRYYEILSCDGSHVRMDRINAGAPLLDMHRDYGSVADIVIGKVEKAWLAGKEGRALVRFAKDDDKADNIWNKVRDGILGNISVGYRVYKYEQQEGGDGTIPTYRATDWEPYELSLVGVPADYKASVRSNNEANNEVLVLTPKSETEMPENNQPVVETPTAEPTPTNTQQPVDLEAVRKAAIEAERKRSADIMQAVRTAKLSDTFASQLIERGVSIDEARAAIINEWAKNDPSKDVTNVNVQRDEAEKLRGAGVAHLAMRSTYVKEADLPKEAVELSRQFRGMTLLDMAKDSLERAGVNTRGMDKMEIVGRAFTSSSSDFPVLLEGTNRRVLLAAYQAVEDVWRQFCSVGNVGDFREYKRLRMGSFGRLDKVNENGEYKTKAIPDGEFERTSIETYGNLINVTRKMIINDDLAAFTRLASMLGRAAALSIEIDVFKLLNDNPTMEDGKALFHADHGNLIGTGKYPSVAAFAEMKKLMAKQKDPSKNDFINLRPSVGLFPIDIGDEARLIIDAKYDPVDNKFEKPNKVRGILTTVVDTPRLEGNPYYFFANPSEEPVLEVSFLDGNQTPFLDSEEGFSVDGIKWKVRHDYGVSAVGWRGAIKNPGAAS